METLVRSFVTVAIALIFIASQIFWLRSLGRWGLGWISNRTWRKALSALGLAVFTFLFGFNLGWIERGPSPVRLTLEAALLEAPFRWWVISSLLGLAVVAILRIVDLLAKAALQAYRKSVGASRQGGTLPLQDPPSPGRRQFLEQTARAVGAAPFIACGYGFFYGRLDLETTHQRIRISRLPRSFDGFRIAQLSDFHIGPFMPAEEIRKYVAITNALKPDLIALTGDFVTWDPETQGAVVEALASLKAPFGIFGCLGNHELWTDTEESITRLFAHQNIRILRQARWPIQSGVDTLNLIGVDYESIRRSRSHGGHYVRRYLERIEGLVMPHTTNILLSHNPNTFDRAAELGIDLSLAGHTHGGQVTLEFIHPSLSPSRLITQYVRGWFQNAGAQLYVNRGIGTIGVPIRLDAPPEITVYELVRS